MDKLPELLSVDKEILTIVKNVTLNAKHMTPELQKSVAKFIEFTATPMGYLITNDDQARTADDMDAARDQALSNARSGN